MDQVIELLTALSSPEAGKRKPAEELFQQGKNQANPDQLVLSFLQALGSPQVDVALRTQSAVLLRQLVNKNDKAFAFSKCTPDNKTGIATELLRLFKAEQNENIRSKIGEVISRLADAACDADDARGYITAGQKGWIALLETVLVLDDFGNVQWATSVLELLKNLVVPMKDDIVQFQAKVAQVIEAGLQNANLKVKSAAFQLVCEMVGVLEKKNWAPLMVTVPVLNSVMVLLAQANEQDELQECLQGYVEIAEVEPDFFKKTLQESLEPAKILAGLVKTKDAPESLRNMALEFLVSYTEKKPKWLAKSLPAFAPLAIECCMHLMLEVDASDEDVKAWTERMDDEEGEEDADELFHSGEEAIDRIVEAMDMENVSAALFGLVAQFATQDQWQAKLAALSAIKQTVEYADDPAHIDQMATLLMEHVDHPHPRVRYTALHAIGQLANDQAPQFQEKSHAVVVPVLLKKMDDGVDRVVSMAMSAFVSFGEELDSSLMMTYSDAIMEKLVQKLTTSNHRMVKEESITSIAVIAGVIEKDFSKYYDTIMPILKQLVMMATGEKESRLRGKAFECMSLLGIAVGKEKFLPDAKEAVQEMLKTPDGTDDLQREYIKEASERICKCLKQDFAFFLPHLLPGIFKNLKLEEDTSKDDDADNFVTVSTGEGKLVKVHTSKFEELLNSVQLLTTFCSEMEGAFFDFVQPTAEALLPLLSASDEVTMLCDEARSAAFQCWALLIKSARKGAEERNQPQEMAQKLLKEFLPMVCKGLGTDKDPDTIREAADGLAECIKNAGPNCLQMQEFQQIAEMMFKLVDDSLARTGVLQQEKQKDAMGAPTELQPDEDEDNDNDDEESCRRSVEEVLGSLMEVVPDQFVNLLPHCETKMKLWLGSKQNATLALFLACDLLQHLKDKSQPLWPLMMPAIFEALTNSEADIRIPAAYAINLAAPITAFGEAATEAHTRLASILAAPAPKKRREEKAKVALDNAVAAMLSLAVHRPEQCPPSAFAMVLGKLPLKDDEEEAKKVHKLLVDQFVSENARLVGGDQANLPSILRVLAEIYKQENICEKETDENIIKVFKALPAQLLQQHAAQFSEKQQKKISRIVSSS